MGGTIDKASDASCASAANEGFRTYRSHMSLCMQCLSPTASGMRRRLDQADQTLEWDPRTRVYDAV